MSSIVTLTMGTHEKHAVEVLVHHNDLQLDATDVLRYLQMLEVQNPDTPFGITDENMTVFLKDKNLIQESGGGYKVVPNSEESRSRIFDAVCEHLDLTIKKCHEIYPNGKLIPVK